MLEGLNEEALYKVLLYTEEQKLLMQLKHQLNKNDPSPGGK